MLNHRLESGDSDLTHLFHARRAYTVVRLVTFELSTRYTIPDILLEIGTACVCVYVCMLATTKTAGRFIIKYGRCIVHD